MKSRREILSLLGCSVPALGLLGAIGKSEADTWSASRRGFPDNPAVNNPAGNPSSAWEKIERNINIQFPTISLENPLEEAGLALNKKIVAEHPSLFPTERIMTAPTCKMFNGHSCGQVITAKSKFMKAEYTVEFALSLKSIYGLDAEEELRNILADEMAIELMRLDDMLKVGEQKSGYALCPYIPVQIIKAVDINTFQPKIRALTMYGVMKL